MTKKVTQVKAKSTLQLSSTIDLNKIVICRICYLYVRMMFDLEQSILTDRSFRIARHTNTSYKSYYLSNAIHQ